MFRSMALVTGYPSFYSLSGLFLDVEPLLLYGFYIYSEAVMQVMSCCLGANRKTELIDYSQGWYHASHSILLLSQP